MTRITCLLLMTLLLAFPSHLPATRLAPLDPGEAKAIGIQEFVQTGHRLEDYNAPVVHTRDGPKNPITTYLKDIPSLHRKLEGKSYLAVEFITKKPMPGGITVIVIDAYNRSILTMTGIK